MSLARALPMRNLSSQHVSASDALHHPSPSRFPSLTLFQLVQRRPALVNVGKGSCTSRISTVQYSSVAVSASCQDAQLSHTIVSGVA